MDVEINEESTGGKAVPIKFSISDNWTKPIVWEQRQSTLGPIGSRSYEPLDASVDVAVAQAPLRLVRENGLDLWGFPPKTHLTKELLRKDKIADQPLNEGDDVFIIGFPTGHDKDSKNWPVVRSGVVAQIQPYLRSNALTFLVDGSVFPGNSGGPVVTKPRALDIDGTEKLKKNALIGMVSGYRTASLGGENADLGIVVPLNAIHDTMDLALNRPRRGYATVTATNSSAKPHLRSFGGTRGVLRRGRLPSCGSTRKPKCQDTIAHLHYAKHPHMLL